jgi:hypothetical protein
MTEYQLPVAPTALWLRDSLRLGPSLSLAKLIADAEDLGHFSFKTFARQGMSERELTDFETGNKAEAADDLIMDLLAHSPLTLDGMLLVEDWRATPESQFLKEMNLPTIVVGREVYFIVRQRDPRRIAHWQRIFSNTVPTFHAFLMDDDPRLVPGTTVSLELLREVARRLRMIVCGAYDGESYVLATR